MAQLLQLSSSTSGTVTATDTQQDLILIHNAGSLVVSLTFAFPSNPRNGQIMIVATDNGITTLTLTTAVGSIINALTGMAVGGMGSWVWVASDSKWHKI